ncbi:MAG: MiaB/RimO family radical SAM methylthiotransferase [Nitrospirae bacterium]|nr:MiaB/RimO family radical SAM methylthiotransferase [Nitrospirota bacterium]
MNGSAFSLAPVPGPAPAPPAALAGKRVRVETMGCRVNRHDAAQLGAALSAMGCLLAEAGAPFDIYLLNTCTVTHQADAEARRRARRARRRCPRARVVLTGCYAEVSPQALLAMPEVDLVVGNHGKADLAARIGALFEPAVGPAPGPAGRSAGGGSVSGAVTRALPDQGGDTRFFLKVQEGCDVACAFCIIPAARGRGRSMPPDDVVDVLIRAHAAGYREAVLAGIHLGGYGEGLGTHLAALVRRVLDETPMPRIRFGSIEPWGLSDAFVELFAAHERLLPFLHVPLQSGSASVLKRMRRPCTPEFYRRRVGRIVAAKPGLTLGADVLTGFPGETAAEFAEGLEFIESLPFSQLHVFPYSRRAGTPAADLPDPVDEAVKRDRVRRLIALSDARRRAALAAQVGTVSHVLVEARGRGHTHNNHPIRLLADPPPPRGRVVAVMVTGVDGDDLLGALAAP